MESEATSGGTNKKGGEEARNKSRSEEEGEEGTVPLIEWAVVSSCKTSDISKDKLRDFFSWLTTELSKFATSMVFETLNFAKEPKQIYLVGPGDQPRMKEAYESVRYQNPSVIVVFQVLPGNNCEEYLWMKQYTWEFGLARQGIQKSNVMNRFDGAGPTEHPEIYRNMVDWLVRRIGQLAHGRLNQRGCCVMVDVSSGDEADGGRKRRVRAHSNDNEEIIVGLKSERGPPIKVASQKEHSVMPVASADDVSLIPSKEIAMTKGHGTTSPETAAEFTRETDLVIEGIPNTFTQFETACVFADYRVKEVRLSLEAESAYIRLGSKFEVMDSVASLDGRLFHGRILIRIYACNPTIQAKLKEPLKQPSFLSAGGRSGGGNQHGNQQSSTKHHKQFFNQNYNTNQSNQNQQDRPRMQDNHSSSGDGGFVGGGGIGFGVGGGFHTNGSGGEDFNGSGGGGSAAAFFRGGSGSREFHGKAYRQVSSQNNNHYQTPTGFQNQKDTRADKRQDKKQDKAHGIQSNRDCFVIRNSESQQSQRADTRSNRSGKSSGSTPPNHCPPENQDNRRRGDRGMVDYDMDMFS